MDSKLVFLIVLVGAVLALGVFFSAPPSAGLTESAARDFISEDVHQTVGGDVCLRSLVVTQTPTGYSGTVYLSVNPNSQCPSVVKRDYTLLPIRFREEQLTAPETNGACPISGVIVHPEEAVRYSAKSLSDQGTISSAATSCAFSFPIGQSSCCPNVDYTSLNEFANTLNGGGATWIVAWKDGTRTVYHALDKTGRTIKAS